MILSDNDILKRLEQGNIVISPAPDLEAQLQPASLDLRLGYDFQTYNYTRQALIDPADPASFEQLTSQTRLRDGERFLVHPGEFVLATTLERIEIPHDLLVRLEGRSSIGRLGIVIHSTAGYLDPGFKGQITLEISNLGRIAVALYPGMRICQIAFEEMSSPVRAGYGERRGSKYQEQSEATASRLFQDNEFRKQP